MHRHIRVKTRMPAVKTLLLPRTSAALPKGSRNTADAMRYEVETQLSSTASMAKACPIRGRAIFTEEPMNGVMKDAMEATTSTLRSLDLRCISSCMIPATPFIFPEGDLDHAVLSLFLASRYFSTLR
jgi:hypothetical protein